MKDKDKLPPYVEEIHKDIDWIRFYIKQSESKTNAKFTGMWAVIIILCFMVGFLVSKL